MMQRTIKRYGWKRDLPDHRDLAYKAVHRTAIQHPPKANLKDHLGQDFVFDQGDLGSCTANSTMYAWQFERGAPGDGSPYWSRMFTYIESLIAEGTYPEDAGAEIRDVIKVLSIKGVPPEKDFPYDVKKFPSKPARSAIVDGKKDLIPVYSRLHDHDDFLDCLASGHPFVLGFTVFESFESETVTKTGVVPMPQPHEQTVGGHAVCCIGYDMNFNNTGKLYYLVQNSWGADWGDPANKGCFWLPAEFLEDNKYASDFWTIRAK